MNATDKHGRLFLAMAVFGLALAALMPLPSSETTLLAMLALVVVLGVPHGALDLIYAVKLFSLHTPVGWLVFLAGYLLLAVSVVAVWHAAPTLFLVGFLAISMFHFSGDIKGRGTLLQRVLYGGGIVILPSVLHDAEMGHLFSVLIGNRNGHPVAAVLHILAWPWLAATVTAALWRFRSGRQNTLEILGVAATVTLLPPIIGFTVYFCFMHSARHILRTRDLAAASWRTLALIAAGPMLATLMLGMAAWAALGDAEPSARIIQLVFVGLAALTVPHMVLVERIRWTA